MSQVERLEAPAGGRLYLGHGSHEVYVPGLDRSLRFQYVTEPPHGDALLQLFSQQRSLPGLVWGSDTWWSPDGRWVLLQWCGEGREFGRTWRLVDLRDWRWTAVDIGRVTAITDELITGHTLGGAATRLGMADLTGWVDLPTPERLKAIDPAIDALRPRG